jgi:hypothetical protein
MSSKGYLFLNLIAVVVVVVVVVFVENRALFCYFRAVGFRLDCIDSNILDSSTLFVALNFALYFRFRGFVLNLYPQHGHHNPSHMINSSHIWQRFCPIE